MKFGIRMNLLAYISAGEFVCVYLYLGLYKSMHHAGLRYTSYMDQNY